MNQIQRVAVAGDFLLRSVRWSRRAHDQGLDPVVRRRDTLDSIGGFGRLDHGHLLEQFQNFGRPLTKQLLPATKFAQPLERREIDPREGDRVQILRNQGLG